MPRPAALTLQEVDDWLAVSPRWTLDGNTLVRQAVAPSFAEAIRWVVAVADAAERADHHPDIDIRWRTLTFRLSTHDVGAVTILDLNLARDIDAIVHDSP
jgi:4a-hydroxytetrahydrobiopterin dehydratase